MKKAQQKVSQSQLANENSVDPLLCMSPFVCDTQNVTGDGQFKIATLKPFLSETDDTLWSVRIDRLNAGDRLFLGICEVKGPLSNDGDTKKWERLQGWVLDVEALREGNWFNLLLAPKEINFQGYRSILSKLISSIFRNCSLAFISKRRVM